MALVFTGSKFSKSGGITAALRKQSNLCDLRPAKRIVVKFDPFGQNTYHIRLFNRVITSTPAKTNPSCRIRTEIVCDRSEPTVTFSLENGETVFMKCAHLDALEMLKMCNKHITPLAPKQEVVVESAIAAKLARKAAHNKK